MFDAHKKKESKFRYQPLKATPQRANYCPPLNIVSHGTNYDFKVVREYEHTTYIQPSFQQTSNNSARHTNHQPSFQGQLLLYTLYSSEEVHFTFG